MLVWWKSHANSCCARQTGWKHVAAWRQWYLTSCVNCRVAFHDAPQQQPPEAEASVLTSTVLYSTPVPVRFKRTYALPTARNYGWEWRIWMTDRIYRCYGIGSSNAVPSAVPLLRYSSRAMLWNRVRHRNMLCAGARTTHTDRYQSDRYQLSRH